MPDDTVRFRDAVRSCYWLYCIVLKWESSNAKQNHGEDEILAELTFLATKLIKNEEKKPNEADATDEIQNFGRRQPKTIHHNFI